MRSTASHASSWSTVIHHPHLRSSTIRHHVTSCQPSSPEAQRTGNLVHDLHFGTTAHPPSSMQRALPLLEHQPQVRQDHSSQNTRERHKITRRRADCTLLSILPTRTELPIANPKKSCPPFPQFPKYPHKLPIAPQRIPIPVNMPPSRHLTHIHIHMECSIPLRLCVFLPPSLLQSIHLSAVGA
ncbi:hypothetical protein CCUS01_14140 [Colletotrichum cuscutae]|uniref:Uncharacterized protein n=1 Tax=Colletotrichum cuscutae TaxID=1209917 RepID=A0AAI9Y9V2_9PEZI|nr:hypothetical protein CCUS01_14140 [Colletotrichum cuscutae]